MFCAGPMPKSSVKRWAFVLFTAVAFTPGCDAFFRNLMIGQTAQARIDPVVNPGHAAMHVHHLTGGGSRYLFDLY